MLALQRAPLTRGRVPHSPTVSDEEHAANLAALEALRNRHAAAEEPLSAAASREIGARTSPLLPLSLSPQRQLMDASRKTCDETRYASAYYAASGGKTPFDKTARS